MAHSDKVYSLFYPTSQEWFENDVGQVLVMSLTEAKHLRTILSVKKGEPIQVMRYEGENSKVYDGPLLKFRVQGNGA